MGAQVYQEQVAARAQSALDAVDDVPWTVRRVIARSMRSPLAGTRRLPLTAVTRADPRTRRLIGRALYGANGVTHRMNLELPPAPRAEIVTLHDVVGSGDEPVAAPDDATGRVAAARVDGDHRGSRALNGPGELVGDTGQQ